MATAYRGFQLGLLPERKVNKRALATAYGLVTLVLLSLIRTVTCNSSFYEPSLVPTVSMALWSHTARSALGGRLLVAGVTVSARCDLLAGR